MNPQDHHTKDGGGCRQDHHRGVVHACQQISNQNFAIYNGIRYHTNLLAGKEKWQNIVVVLKEDITLRIGVWSVGGIPLVTVIRNT